MAKKRKGVKKVKGQTGSAIDSGDEEKHEKWNVEDEGFYKDEIDNYLEEKEILSLQRSGRKLDDDSFSEAEGSDEEVLKLDLPESEEDEEEDGDNEEETHLGPSQKAWGKRKKDFYNTDYIDDEGDHTSDESLAEEEEREALSLQQRMLESIHDTDYGLETVPEPLPSPNLDLDQGPITPQKDFLALTKEEQLKFIEEEWPEFVKLYNDLKAKESVINQLLVPLVKRIEISPENFTSRGANFVSNLSTLYNLYCLNVTFYLTLRASRMPIVEDHPVMSRIINIREIMSRMQDFVTRERLTQLVELSNNDDNNTNIENVSKDEVLVTTTKKRQLETTTVKEDPLEFYERIKRAKIEKKNRKRVSFSQSQVASDEEEEEEEEEGDKKRGVTYEIARNKGMTPKRKKEQRNPRVKHRKKFEKAITKHRRIVRPVEKELYRYGGEKGGIKSRLTRSTKIK